MTTITLCNIPRTSIYKPSPAIATLKSILEKNNFVNVKKSSCTFCPYHNNKTWKDLKNNYPEEWDKAVKLDEIIRDSSQYNIKDKLYLHSSKQPLDKAYLQEDQEELFMCEEGYCGI